MPQILGLRVDPISYESATRLVLNLASQGKSSYVCVTNVHMVIEAYDSTGIQAGINKADLVTPDGMPLVWTLRHMGFHHQIRVYGPTLTRQLLIAAEKQNPPFGFYGSTPNAIENLGKVIEKHLSRSECQLFIQPTISQS